MANQCVGVQTSWPVSSERSGLWVQHLEHKHSGMQQRPGGRVISQAASWGCGERVEVLGSQPVSCPRSCN